MTFERLLKWYIDRHPVISFDIFDTLIKRNIAHPADLFRVVEERYNTAHSSKIQDFKANRRSAEKRARIASSAEEVTLEEIYAQLKDVCPEAEELKRLELQAEHDYCQVNYAVKKWYDYCVRKKKRILITSDMYLPKETVVSLLQQCGYDHYEKLLLSSDYKLTKASGHLYDALLKETGVKPSAVLHFGDSRRHDMLNAVKKGIHIFPISKERVNTYFLKKSDIYAGDSWLLPYINNNILRYRDRSEAFRWGYEALGSLFAGFCLWIMRMAEQEQIEKLYFIARDTYQIIDAYRLLGGTGDLSYLEVSRRSLRREYVKTIGSIDNVVKITPKTERSAKGVLASMGLDPKGLDLNPGFPLEKGMQNLSPEEREELNIKVLDAVRHNSGFALEYLRQQGMLAPEKTALIDIGWHGTIQNMLEAICKKPFVGLYFGSTRWRDSQAMNVHGYWFQESNDLDAGPKMTIVSILEIMLFPKVGTTLEYSERDGGYYPVYDSFCSPKFSFIEEFQQGAMQLVRDLSAKPHYLRTVDASEAARAYELLAFKPSHRVLKAFSSLELEDGKIKTLAKIRPRLLYLVCPHLLIKDYKEAMWKEGFIKNLLPWVSNPHALVCMIKWRRNAYKAITGK